MAKTPWILFGATGKLGNIVLQRADNKTVVRERVTTIKNPRTLEQQTQRMKMTTVMGAYSSLKEICDHSFEGISYGAKSMQYFMKQNYAILNGSENPNYNFRQNKTYVPNRYLISQGSINVNITENIAVEENKTCYETEIPMTSLSTLTVQQFHDALGINVGDQLTFVVVGYYTDSPAYTYQTGKQYQTTTMVARYIFDPAKATAKLTNAEVQDGEIFDPANLLPESIVPQYFVVNLLPVVGSNVCLVPTYGPFDQNLGFSFIVSRKENSTWLRSTSYMLTTWNYLNNTWAINTYGPTTMYLNNAID